MGYWTKRTQEEINTSIKNKDYNGGYKFWPWLFWTRRMYVVGLLFNLLAGWIGGMTALKPENENPTSLGYGLIGFFGILAPVLIAFLLVRDYKDGKKGISK